MSRLVPARSPVLPQGPAPACAERSRPGRHENAVDPVTDEALLQRLAAAFNQKWGGDMWQYEARDGAFHHPEGGAAVVFSVAPAKVFAHAKGHPFGATTHRFGRPPGNGSGA